MKPLWAYAALLFSTFAATAARITDDLGHPLVLTAPATRVVALSPHTAELLLAAGGSAQLIAAPAQTANLPPHVRQIRTFGGIDREYMMRLAPDLVLAWASGNRATDIAWLRRQGIPVYQSEPQDLQQIADSLSDIGRLIGRPEQGEQAARDFLLHLKKACAGLPEQEIYVEIWDRPPLSVGGQHWLNDALAQARLHNTFAHVERAIFSLESEALLSRSPLLRLTPREGKDSAGHLYIAGLSRPGPGLADAVARLCRTRSLSRE